MHLHVLALAAIALHQLLLARDGRRPRVHEASSTCIGRLTLEQERGVATAEDREAPLAQLPDALHDVVEERAVV